MLEVEEAAAGDAGNLGDRSNSNRRWRMQSQTAEELAGEEEAVTEDLALAMLEIGYRRQQEV